MIAQAGAADTSDTDNDRGERWFVWIAWFLVSAMVFGYIIWFGRNLPYWEDWDLVAVLTGAQPFNFGWLTAQVLEHRYFLSRLLLYPIWWLSGGDFRGAMFVNAALLVGTAAASLATARRLRGRTSYFDAFFPLVLLNLGHHESLIFFVQLYFVLPVVLFLWAIMAIVTDLWKTPARAAALAIVIALLPLNGGIGLLLAPPLMLWSAGVGWRQRGRAAIGFPLLAAVLVAAVEIGLYFVGYHSPVIGHTPRTFVGVARTTLEALSVTFGPYAAALWPLSGPAMAALLLATGAGLGMVMVRQPGERLRALGLLMGVSAIALVALGIGYGRSVLGPHAGFPGRYALLLVPALCITFYASILYVARPLGRFVQAVLFAGTCAMLGLNAQSGLVYAQMRDQVADALMADLRNGVEPAELARRYSPALGPNVALITSALRDLRKRDAGPYKGVEAPLVDGHTRCHGIDVTPDAIASNDVIFIGDWAIGHDNDPNIVYALPAPMRVCALILHYQIAYDRGENDNGADATSQVFWRDADFGETFIEEARTTHFRSAPGDQQITLPIYAMIDQFRFDPDDRAVRFKLDHISVRVAD